MRKGKQGVVESIVVKPLQKKIEPGKAKSSNCWESSVKINLMGFRIHAAQS